MGSPVIYDDDGILLTLPGSALGGIVWDVHPFVNSPPFQVTTSIVVTAAPPVYPVFKLPDLYNYYPEIVRWMDKTYVNRDDIPLYYWDSVPRWDAEPFTWDEVIGPEPILKTTTRIIQMELEKSAQEISDLLTLYNLDRCQPEILPYHAALMGTPLPAAKEEEQRAFLEELGWTYRRKGTPLSFFRLFESLGFTMTLEETYHRKADAYLVPGPQMAMVSVNHITGETIGITSAITTHYEFQLEKTPLQRGGVTLKIYSPSTVTPTEVTDDGTGSWTAGYGGTIDYQTGSCTLDLPTIASLPGQAMTSDYYYMPDAFPDPFETKWINRWRSSVVYFALTSKDSTVNLTDELNDRLLLYLNLLKPAHIVVSALTIVFNMTDDETVNELDTLDMFAYLHAESLFGTLYLGYGWAAEDNASINNNPVYSPNQERIGHEFLMPFGAGPANPAGVPMPAGHAPIDGATLEDTAPASPDVGDFWIDTTAAPTVYDLYMCTNSTTTPATWALVQAAMSDPTRWPNLPPYTYPFKMDGLFTQPSAMNYEEADWINIAPVTDAVFDTTVTNDIAVPLVTNFSIDEDVGTLLGIGDTVTFINGPAGGEARRITAFTDAGTYYDVTVAPAFSVAPAIGNTVAVIAHGKYESLVTVDIPVPLVANFSIDFLAGGTRLGVGDQIVITRKGSGYGGATGRMVSTITGFANVGPGNYYNVAVAPAFTEAPTIGDVVTVRAMITPSAVHLDNLDVSNRPQDPLDLLFGEVLAPAPNGINLGPFAVTITAAHRPLPAASWSYLRFTVAAVAYEERAMGTGAFSNVSGLINASSINYTTGVVSVTFLAAPDNGTEVSVFSGITSSLLVGVC
jgi:P2-related tail formation protein